MSAGTDGGGAGGQVGGGVVDSEEEARVTERVLGGRDEASEFSKDCCCGWIFLRNCLFLLVTWREPPTETK